VTKVNASAVDRVHRGGRPALAPAVLALLLLALSACGKERPDGEAEPYPPPNPTFYEVVNSGGEVEGWLFGTIHALPDGVLWSTPPIDQAVDDADLLLVEVANLGVSDEIARTFAELSESPGLLPLSERVSAELRPDLEIMLDRSDQSEAGLQSSEDWAAAIMLARVDAPGNPKNGVDRALIEEFSTREVLGFETARGQLSIFDNLATQDQRDLLEGTIEEWASSRDNPERLMRAWLVGDLKTLESATTNGIMADPELRAALLVDRNTRWMEQLLPILQNQPRPLIAVGAAHLVGPDGLVTMLEEAGYSVNRLPTS